MIINDATEAEAVVVAAPQQRHVYYYVLYEQSVASLNNNQRRYDCRTEAELVCIQQKLHIEKWFHSGAAYGFIASSIDVPDTAVNANGDDDDDTVDVQTQENALWSMRHLQSVERDIKVYPSSVRFHTYDTILNGACQTQTNPEWGLSRIDQLNLPLYGDWRWDLSAAGNDVVIYLIDSGIELPNVEFASRLSASKNQIGNTVGDGITNDCNGHGTHVASIILGSGYGVARGNSDLYAVKVFPCDGAASLISILDGLDIAAAHHASHFGSSRRALINLSLGTDVVSPVFNAVVDALALENNMYSIVSSGNDNSDGCLQSPCSADTVLCVGSSTIADDVSSFSNTGSCVHVMTPGTSIRAAGINGVPNTVKSGTSMACGFATGIVAVRMSQQQQQTTATPRSIINDLVVADKLNFGSRTGSLATPNKLATFGAALCSTAGEIVITPSPVPATVSTSKPTTAAATTMTTTRSGMLFLLFAIITL